MISCLIPAYNAAAWIEKAIQSVLEQKLPPQEVLVYDDGSTDDTAAVVGRFRDRRVILLPGKPNRGASYARNMLMGHAQGQYFVWQDADDWSHPDRFEKQFHFIVQNSLVGCGTGLVFVTNGVHGYTPGPTVGRENVRVAQQGGAMGCFGATFMFHRRVFDHGIRFNTDLRIGEDQNFQVKIQSAWPKMLDNIEEVLYYYRIHPESVYQTFMRTQVGNSEAAQKVQWDEIGQLKAKG